MSGRWAPISCSPPAGETIGGMLTKPAMIPAPFWLYYFNVGDLDAAAQRVKAGGGRDLRRPL